jgi:hypothetical protein
MAEYAHHSSVNTEWAEVAAKLPPRPPFDGDWEKEIAMARKASVEIWAPANRAIWERQIPGGARSELLF